MLKLKWCTREYFLYDKLKSLKSLNKLDAHKANYVYHWDYYCNWVFASDQGFGITAVTNITYDDIKAKIK